jgi:ATPase subunit of ABC transporter with duplicated ATPase domains
MPSLIRGDSDKETLEPDFRVTNFGAWFAGLLAYAPSAYGKISEYLKQVMPDLNDIKNPVVGTDSRSLVVQFSNEQGSVRIPFEDLSDGEKCFMICALVLAANDAYGPLLCFWDEPDNFLDLSEVGHFVLALRTAFQYGGQFIATSHNPEAIRRFSDENTLLLYRKSHLEPTIVRPIDDLQVSGDLVDALIRGDVEP